MADFKVRVVFSFLVTAILLNWGWLSPIAEAQTTTRLTFNSGNDIYPAWDPRGVTIAYLRSKSAASSVYDAYKVDSSGQAGEEILMTGLNADFGVAVNLSWIGTTGFLGIEEAISGFEELKFDTSQAPFDRTISNGSDAANEILLNIDGGGGGGIFEFSRDGSTVLTRFSSSGSGGNVSIRSGLVSALKAQAASTFGTALISLNVGSDDRFYFGASLNPDGSKYVLAVPISTSGTAHDLFISDTSASGTPVNITNTAASGYFNVYPEFSPDGTKIAFARKTTDPSDSYDLYLINTDGTGLTQLTNTPNFSEITPSWSPDGSSIAFTGTHVTGHETETPALLSGEKANPNIYILTLSAAAADKTVTPKTILTDPPIVNVLDNDVTFTLAPFVKAQKAAQAAAKALVEEAEAKSPKAKFSFKYDLVITKDGGKKKDTRKLLSKRNTITSRNFAAGSYQAKYRVQIFKKIGKITTTAGRTKFSPVAGFSVIN